MKKRNKKYNPKQIIQQKVHKFQMFWEEKEATRTIELHHLMNGTMVDQSTHTPFEVWVKAHKGDLSIALKTETIPPEQSYHLVSRIHAVNKETGQTIDCEFQLATASVMHLWDFLGSDVENRAPIYVEDKGIKTLWKGFEHELKEYLNSIGGDEYEVVTNHCCLTCFSTFKSFRHEMEFKAAKLIHPGNGLGVAA